MILAMQRDQFDALCKARNAIPEDCQACITKTAGVTCFVDTTHHAYPGLGNPSLFQPLSAFYRPCLAGTALRSLLGRFGISAEKSGCQCKDRAAYMDSAGCDWVEANVETVVGWLREEATKRGLPFLDAVGLMLVKRAVSNARRNAAAVDT